MKAKLLQRTAQAFNTGFDGDPITKEIATNTKLASAFTNGRLQRAKMLDPANIYLQDYTLTPSTGQPQSLGFVFWFRDKQETEYCDAAVTIDQFGAFLELTERLDLGYLRTIDRETGEQEWVKTGEMSAQHFIENEMNSDAVVAFISQYYLKRKLPSALPW